MTIFWIAALPTIIIFLVAGSTGSRIKTIVATLLVATVGALAGNPTYTVIDIGAAVMAFWFCWIVVLPVPRQKSGDEIRREAVLKAARLKKVQEFIGGALTLAAIAFFWGAYKLPKQPLVQNQTTAKTSIYPKCNKSLDVLQCEALERNTNVELNAETLSRKANLEVDQARSVVEGKKKSSGMGKGYKKSSVIVVKDAELNDIPESIAYDPPGGTSITPSTPQIASKEKPYVYDRGGHQG